MAASNRRRVNPQRQYQGREEDLLMTSDIKRWDVEHMGKMGLLSDKYRLQDILFIVSSLFDLHAAILLS